MKTIIEYKDEYLKLALGNKTLEEKGWEPLLFSDDELHKIEFKKKFGLNEGYIEFNTYLNIFNSCEEADYYCSCIHCDTELKTYDAIINNIDGRDLLTSYGDFTEYTKDKFDCLKAKTPGYPDCKFGLDSAYYSKETNNLYLLFTNDLSDAALVLVDKNKKFWIYDKTTERN